MILITVLKQLALRRSFASDGDVAHQAELAAPQCERYRSKSWWAIWFAMVGMILIGEMETLAIISPESRIVLAAMIRC